MDERTTSVYVTPYLQRFSVTVAHVHGLALAESAVFDIACHLNLLRLSCA